MSRIPPVAPEAMSPETAALLASRPPYNVYRVLANAPAALPGFVQMAGALLGQGALDAGLRELAILRVGALSGSRYEVHQHLRIARRVGLDEARIARALDVDGHDDPATDDGRVLAFTTAVVREVKAPDALFDAVSGRLGHGATLELLLAIGFYMMVARVLENAEVPLETHDMERGVDGFYGGPAAR